MHGILRNQEIEERRERRENKRDKKFLSLCKFCKSDPRFDRSDFDRSGLSGIKREDIRSTARNAPDYNRDIS